MFRLDGKVALVTGGGSGIGREIALLFAQQGAQVWIGDINEDAGGKVAGEIAAAGGSSAHTALDVTDASSVESAVAMLTAADSRLDIMVNNAGVSCVGTVVETSEEDFDRVMKVNAKGVFLGSKYAVQQMLRQDPQGGVIINMASISSVIGLVDRLAYNASKGAVLQMTRAVAMDHIKEGVRCNAICPARVHTPFVDDYLARHYPGQEQEMFAKLSAYQPIGRMGEPAEVAAMALYLASDEAAFVTGAAHMIDGGVTAQ